MIVTRSVKKAYGENIVVNDVSLALQAGGVTSIIGPNGAGKSTLLSMISRLLGMDAGSVQVDGRYEITQYTSCMNTARGVYYYTTYDNSRISAIDLHAAPMDGNRLFSYPLHESSQILRQNPNDYSIF